MLVSTKGRYALRVMLYLGLKQTTGNIALKDIAESEQISEKYLEAIIKDLVAAGMVVGVRGKGGGYRLTQEAHNYTAWDILVASEGKLEPIPGVGDMCSVHDDCALQRMWKGLGKEIEKYLRHVHLSDLVAQSAHGGVWMI